MIKPKIGICKQCKSTAEDLGVEPKEKAIYAKGLCSYHYKMAQMQKKISVTVGNMVYKASDFPASKIPPGKKKFPKKTGELEMFKQIWEEREHICINCKVYLGEELIVHYFSHRKGKGANPELRLDKDNIDLLCRDCHYARDFQGIDKFKSRTK